MSDKHNHPLLIFCKLKLFSSCLLDLVLFFKLDQERNRVSKFQFDFVLFGFVSCYLVDVNRFAIKSVLHWLLHKIYFYPFFGCLSWISKNIGHHQQFQIFLNTFSNWLLAINTYKQNLGLWFQILSTYPAQLSLSKFNFKNLSIILQIFP